MRANSIAPKASKKVSVSPQAAASKQTDKQVSGSLLQVRRTKTKVAKEGKKEGSRG